MNYLLTALVIAALAAIIYYDRKDKRARHRKTVESIGDDLWRDIDNEREENIERGKKFRRLLNDVRKRDVK